MLFARTSVTAFAALSFATAAGAAGDTAPAEKNLASGTGSVAAVAATVSTPEAKVGDVVEKPVGQGSELVGAKPAPATRVEPTLIAKVDLTAQRLTIIVDGKSAHTWPISSGAQGYATPVGSFTPGWKAKMWYSKQYDDAPMPHAVFFKNGAAIHATQAIGSLGRPASHGCVRLAPGNAATFYGLVGKHGLSQTRVIVFGSPKFAPAIAQRSQPPASGAVRAAYPRVAYTNYAPRPVTAYAPSNSGGGFNNGGSWFGGGGYAYAQQQPARYVQPGGYYGQRMPRAYRPN